MKVCTSIQQIDRFWGKVDKSGDCWEWGAYKDKQGYGQFGLDGKLQYVHRVSYIWARGVIPEGKAKQSARDKKRYEDKKRRVD